MSQEVDVTPGAHNGLDAQCEVSYKLACGCTIPPDGDPEDRPFLYLEVGYELECYKHGMQVITRRTTRLTGWRIPNRQEREMREAFGIGKK